VHILLCSPKGNQFATCKEVSSYLMSLLGYPEPKTVTIQYSSTANPDLSAGNGRADVSSECVNCVFVYFGSLSLNLWSM
jgi:hypothetical protein